MSACFGTHSSGFECSRCQMERGCRSFQVTDGLEFAAATVDALVAVLPDKDYVPVSSIKALIELLADPDLKIENHFPSPQRTGTRIDFNQL